jgi:hypothetical protein
MKSFYEMMMLMEQGPGLASVERFPQDFERVLNFIAGGPWNFVTNEYSPFATMGINSGLAVFYIRAEYRGMSESGRYYKVAVRLVNEPNPPINRNGASRFMSWKQEFVSYDPKGSPEVYFELEEINELGPDTDGRQKITSPEVENPTPEQEKMQTMIQKLGNIRDELDKDLRRLGGKPKWTPERRVYFYGIDGPVVKNAGVVDLAKQIRNLIAKREKEHPTWDSY